MTTAMYGRECFAGTPPTFADVVHAEGETKEARLSVHVPFDVDVLQGTLSVER